MSILAAIIRWWNKLRNNQSVIEAYSIDNIAISEEMLRLQELYLQIVRGKAPWNLPPDGVPSLMLASSISAEVAQNVVVGLESDVIGGTRKVIDEETSRTETLTNSHSEYLNEQYIRAKEKLRNAVIAACNCGEIVFKPYIRLGRIEITVVETDCYLPIAYNMRNELIDVVFGSSTERDRYAYKLFERHSYDETKQQHVITYKAFKSERTSQGFFPESAGTEISVSSVPEWADLKDTTIHNIRQPLFVHFKIPTSGTVESPQRQGLPIWSKAVDMLRKADQHEARTDWEFEGGELAIDAPLDWFGKDKHGNPVLPKGKERLFRAFNNSDQDNATAIPYNPEFRISGLEMRMNQILRRIEFLSGLSYGILSDNNNNDKTAEEFRASKRRLFTTVSDIQEALKKAMEHLVSSFSVLAELQGVPRGDYELTWIPSDSIMADREREFDERIRAQAAGWLSKQENRAWWCGVDVDSEEARNLPKSFEEEY